ncbi:Beta-2 adrenergic receptor [Hypsibius exemplaris]|uniref:Beta-2 adrenergic receptor n=1 Tax=Hypsibius exemplaris TaxID=2072580 RepID=A0A1W0W985_HYPEX|nr:Beta-2 adrenergic receptor [Hypsibius exemplaris]
MEALIIHPALLCLTGNLSGDGNGSGDAYNSSICPTSSQPESKLSETPILNFFLGALYVLIIFVSFVGNSLVIIAVISTHKLKTITNYLLASLAVADLTVTVLVLPFALVYDINQVWYFGSTFCLFWMSWDVTSCTASLQHLCAVAVDRYFAINDPLHYYERMSSRKAAVIVMVIWLNSSCIAYTPIFLGWYAKTDQVAAATGQCFLDINKTYAVFSAAISFYIPLIIMGVCYCKIFSIALHQSKEIKRMQRSIQHNYNSEDSQCLTNKSKNLASERKAIKTLGIIFGMFYICWQPFFIIYWIYAFDDEPNIPNWIRSSITWLGYINSAMNPIVYALNPDFRSAYKRILLTILKKGPCRFVWKEDRYGGYGSPRDQRNASPLTIPEASDSDYPATGRTSMSLAAQQQQLQPQLQPFMRNYGTTPPPPLTQLIKMSQPIKMSQLNGLHSSASSASATDRTTPDKSLSNVVAASNSAS